MDREDILNALAAALGSKMGTQAAFGTKTTGLPSGTPSLPYYSGPNGLWSMAGVERDIISTRIQPVGLAGALPARATNITNPFFAYLTGFADTTGQNPNGVCDDPKTAGATYNCVQTAQFGRYSFQTRELELNRVGQRINISEPIDLRIMNDPLLAPGVNGNGIVAPTIPAGTSDLRREVLQRFVELGISFQNQLIRQVWQANPANNTGGGGYQEFPGLDILIGTNKKDAFTGTSCPSLNSDIKNFNYKKVDDQSADIVNVLTYMYRYVSSNADRSGLAPVNFAFVMRRELFYEISAVWPCSYLTYRCSFRNTNGTEQVNIDAGDQIAMRDTMRQNSYLLIDGQQVRVILDDGINEETAGDTNKITPNGFASDIYLVPLSVRGGLSSLYWEYFDFSQGPMQAVQDGRYTDDFWTDSGQYFWHKKPPINWCVQWLAKIEPRIVLLTPHLAARLQHVQYSPLQHLRDPFSDDPYFIGGGDASRSTAPSLYADWKS